MMITRMKLGGNLPPGHDAPLFSISDTGVSEEEATVSEWVVI